MADHKMSALTFFAVIFIIGSAHGTRDVDTAWMRTTIQSHFSQPRNHVSNPMYKRQAKNFIFNQFVEYGLEAHIHTFSTGIWTAKGKNVIGVSKGKYFKTAKDRVVGVAAHYDTARGTPGVDSNGAGVVGMLQAAKHLAKIPRDFTVVFVAFDFLVNEGITCVVLGCGSVSFMKEWWNTYWPIPPTTIGFIVMDTIMNFNDNWNSQSLPVGFNLAFPNVVSSIISNNNKGDFLAIIGRPFDRDVLNSFIQSYKALGQPEFGSENIYISSLTDSTITVGDIILYSDLMRSDHRTFWSRGIPSIFLTDTANFRGYMKTCFHKSCDDMSRVTDKMIQFAGKTTQAVIDTVNKLAPGTVKTTQAVIDTVEKMALDTVKKIAPDTVKKMAPDTVTSSRTGLVTSNADIDTAWMETTLQHHFSEPRHHVTNPTYKAAARDFILNEFRSYGLDVYGQTFDTNLATVKGVNVIGISKGKYFNTNKDQIVGVAAHYDTMRNTPGVDDNGAAVVAMLQTAKHMAKSSRSFTVIFVAFDFEEWEQFLPEIACTSLSCGSRKFVSDWMPSFWTTFPVLKGFIVMDTIANIHETSYTQEIPVGLGMIAPGVVSSVDSDGKKGDFIAAIGRAYDSDVLDAFVSSYAALGQPEFELEKINIAVLTDKTLTQQQFYMFNDLIRSDHYSFWKNGMRAIFLTDTANFRGYMKQCYHDSCDALSRFTPKMFQFLTKTTRALIATVNKLAPSSDQVGCILSRTTSRTVSIKTMWLVFGICMNLN